MAKTPDTATHQITTPPPGALKVSTFQHGSRYYIDADGVPDDAGDHCAPVGPLHAGQGLDDPSRYAPARERENQLRRDRDRGALDGHRDDDADVPETTVQRVDERKDELVDGLDQVSVS